MTDEKWLASLPVNTIFRITIQMVGSEYRDRMAVVRGFTRYKPRMPFEWYHIPYDKKRRKYRQTPEHKEYKRKWKYERQASEVVAELFSKIATLNEKAEACPT